MLIGYALGACGAPFLVWCLCWIGSMQAAEDNDLDFHKALEEVKR